MDIQKVTQKNASEYAVHQWVAEASSLGIRPGLTIHDLDTELGNGRPFVYRGRDEHGVIYQQSLGCLRLRVLDD